MDIFVLISTLLLYLPSATCLCSSIPLSSLASSNLQSATSIKDIYFNIANVVQTNKVFCAKVGKNFSIQFDFSTIKTVTRLDIRGLELNKTMMMLHSFTLHFSVDKKNWFDYSPESDKLKIFDVEWLFISSKSKVIEHILPKPAIGRYMQLRSVPNSLFDFSNICLNVVVYGCNEVMPPSIVAQKEIKAYLKRPTLLSCHSEGMMNYSLTLSFSNQKQIVYLNSSRTQLHQQLSISKVTSIQIPNLSEYSCVTSNRILQCKKMLTCSAEQLFSSHQKVFSESAVVIEAELPEQLITFRVLQKTTATVLLDWTLPDLNDIPKKYWRLKLNCSTMNSPVQIDELRYTSFELTNLSPYQSCRCTLELKLKYNISIDLNQKPAVLEFHSRSERPNIVPKLVVVKNGSQKIKLKVEAKFENPKFGKLMGCYVYITQLHGKQFRSVSQTNNLTFPLSAFNSIHIKDLLPWTYYNISVVVFNDDYLLSNVSYLQHRTSQSRPSGAPIIEIDLTTATTITCILKQDSRYPDNGLITSYEIEYNPGNHTCNVNIDEMLGEQQFFHIQNLKPNTMYQIRSRSKNKVGYGPFSDYIFAMTDEHTPNEPTDIEYKKKHQNLILTWHPASPTNGNITKYEIQITLRNRTVVTIFTLTFTDFDTNIPFNSVFTVAIRAYTSKGYGQFSLVIQVYQASGDSGSSEYGQNSRILIVAFCITLLCLVALGICGFKFYKRCHSQPPQSRKSSLFVHYVPSKVDEKEELLFQEKSKLPTESLSDPIKNHDPIPVESFAQYINRAEQNNYEILVCEFKNETMSGKCYPWEVADRPENRPKNRYGDIAAYDHSRVILKFDCKRKQSDYINASYIQGCECKSEYKYISSQGPMENGLNDFWHMIYQENIKIIVMLTNLIENEKEKCCQYWPDEGFIKYSSVSVTLVKIDKTADYVIRLFHIQKIGAETEDIRLVRQFHFVSWPDHGVPDYPTALLSLRRRVRHYYSDDSPMLVHCSAGVGRSGCFILIDNMLDKIDNERTVDIFNYLQHLRSRRTNMVQTLEQYIFAHEAILEYIEFGNTEITLDNLDKKTKELMNGTGMADEFSVLCQSTQSDMQGSNLYKVLLSEGKYIDASYVDGYKQRNSFILTLAPKEDSAYEFWKMVIEQQCHTIVMLAKCQEGVEDYYRYWPDVDGECSYHDLNVFLCSEVANGNIVTRKIKIVSRKLRCEVNHFQYMDWPNGDVPHRRAYPNICTLMQSAEKSQQQLGNGPIIVHAGNDYGRSGTFVAIYNSTERLKVEQLIDVLQCVRTIRIAQPLAVDNVLQYQFVYQLLRIYLEGFENYWNYKDYKVCKSPKSSVSTC